MRSTLKMLACAVVALALLAPLAAPSTAGARSTCANRLCTKDKPRVKSCYRHDHRKPIAKCFIRRAARHFHQSRRRAYYIAWRESRYHWHARNPSGAGGLYQFMPRTWHHTPYRHHSRYNPRWASLAAMWMWKHGGYSHWG
jgi:soluble lytic murein transglycosylase-like protein